MAKPPIGYKWVTINGRATLIKDRNFNIVQDKDTKNFTKVDSKPEDPKEFVSDTELYEYYEEKDKQIARNKREADKRNPIPQSIQNQIKELEIRGYRQLIADTKKELELAIGRRDTLHAAQLRRQIEKYERELVELQ